MGVRNKINEGYPYFLTLTIVEWVDLFTRPALKNVIIDSIRFCQKEKGLIVYAWCLMSNHLHMIAGAKEGYHLSDILRDFKKFTSKDIIHKIDEINESRKEWILAVFQKEALNNPKNKYYKVWQDGNDAKELITNDFIDQKLDYIHMNPVIAEIVERPEDYIYSSAKDYCDEKGLLDIVKME